MTTIVLFIAASFRLIAINDIPPGLAQDEVLDADIASFIRGGEHALFFRHGYGHEPLYHYWAVPFQAAFGDNVLSIRLPAVFLGLLLVALTMRWVRRDFGAVTALTAGIGLAISWWPIIFSRIGIRPILEPVLIVLAMWFWPLKAIELNRNYIKSAVVAGLWLGLSIYSYTAARIILLIPMMLLLGLLAQWFISHRREPENRDRLEFLRTQILLAAVVLLVGSIVYLPMALTLRANPDLQQRIEQLEGPLTALREGDVGPVLETTVATLGVFSFTGDPRWTYSLPGRPLFDPLTAILFYGGLIIAVWRWRSPIYLILPIWLFIALMPSALSPDAPSTVRIIGALPVIFVFPGLSVDRLLFTVLKRRGSRRALRLSPFILAFLAILVLFNGYRTIRDGFIRWPKNIETRERYQSVFQDIARYWVKNGMAPSVVADAFFEQIDADSLRRNIGADPAARWIQSGQGVSGAVVWPGGADGAGLLIYVPEYAPLDPQLMEVAGISTVPAYRSDVTPSYAVYGLPVWNTHRWESLAIDFADNDVDPGTLLSFEGIADFSTKPDSIELITAWRILHLLPPDMAIFIHLLDSSGAVVAQFDGLDAAAETLRPGDTFLQRHIIDLPEGLLPGDYSLRLGLYKRGNGDRLITAGENDSVELAGCQVNEGDLLPLCRLTEID